MRLCNPVSNVIIHEAFAWSSRLRAGLFPAANFSNTHI